MVRLSILQFLVWCGMCTGLVVLANQNAQNGAMVAIATEEETEDASVAEDTDPADRNLESFVPTDEWQTIKEGQSIPGGLHIRMNLATGKKEAKLMEPEGGEKEQSNSDGDSDVDKSYTGEQLKQALKKLKVSEEDLTVDKEREARVRQQHRSMEELKREFADLRMGIQTELEIVQELVDLYSNQGLDEADRVKLLTQLEYYLHQMDNAQDFVTLGGLSLVLRDLNHTAEAVRSEAVFVLGSATQSNPKVKIAALEGGALQRLTRMLHLETSPTVRSRVVYALSAILRHFPLAQRHFLELGGLQGLAHAFNQGPGKLQVKVVTVISDLLLEQKHTLVENSEDTAQQEKVEQYKSVPLLQAVIEQGWCDLLPDLLTVPEHDGREKVLVAMETLVDSCRDRFSRAHRHLIDLKSEYESLAREETLSGDGDYYFTTLLQSVNRLMDTLWRKDEL